MEKNTAILAPENWSEITLSQFQEIQTLDKTSENYDVNLISIVCDIDPDEIGRLHINTYSSLLLALSWMVKLPAIADYKPIIKHNGKEYGLVKMSSFTNGQWFSLETWMEDHFANAHKILAMVYRPLVTALNDDYRITEDYEPNSAELRAEEFKSLPISDCYGAILFFSIIEKQSIKTIKGYLEIKVVTSSMRMIPQRMRSWIQRRNLRKFAAGTPLGIPFFTTLLKGISRKYQKSQS